MHAFFGRLRPWVTLLKVILLLLVVDQWVRGPFFARSVAPLYVDRFTILRERTWGQNVLVLLEAMRRRPGAMHVTFLGDSVLRAVDEADETTVPYLVQRQLRERFAPMDVDVVDCSAVGLYASDAMLLTSKLVGAGSDVIVYEVLPRAVPRAPDQEWVTRVSSQLSPSDLWRVLRVGGAPWLARNLTAAQITDGLVNTSWALYAYRSNLKLFVWDVLLPRVFPYRGLVRWMFYGPEAAAPPTIEFRPHLPGKFEWTWAEYGPPNANWDALNLFGRLCHQYQPGRCVIYSGPLNPLGRAQAAEPELFDAYLAHLRAVAGRYGLVWRDYTDTMTPADFAPPKYVGVRDPIHLNGAGNAKLAQLLQAPVAEAVRAAAADRGGRGH
jgi:hypothetical protein